MTPAQTLELEAISIRDQLNELNGETDWTDEQRAENERLTARYREVEQRRAAALILEQEQLETAPAVVDDGTDAELRRLTDAASADRIMAAALVGRATTGADAELQQHYDFGSNEMPLSMLLGRPEERTITITNSGTSDSLPLTRHLLQTPASTFLGTDVRMIPPGQLNVPVVTSSIGIPSSPTAVGTAVTDGSVTITNYNLSPSRLQKRIIIGRDQIYLNPRLLEEMRGHLGNAVEAGLDEYIVDQTVAAKTAPSDPTDVVSWATIRDDMLSAIDGVHAGGLGEVRILVRPTTLQAIGKTYQTVRAAQTYSGTQPSNSINGLPAQTGETDAIQWLSGRTGGVRAFKGLATSSNIDVSLILRGGQTNVVVGVWDRLTIEDPYTDAAKGQLNLNVAVYAAVQVVQLDAVIREAYLTA